MKISLARDRSHILNSFSVLLSHKMSRLFINLFFFSTITILFSTEIIPLKKPIQTKAEKDQKLLIDVMKPLPKPIPKKIVEEIKKKPEGEIKLKAEKDLGIILPKKKPLIAGTKKTDTAKKSKYYNKKDFEIAKKAISEMKQIFDQIVRVASGYRTKSEKLGFGGSEFVPWQIGAVM